MADSAGTLSYLGDSVGIRSTFRAPYLVRLWTADKMQFPSQRISLAEVSRASIGRGEGFFHERTHDGSVAHLQIRVADGWMSSTHVELQESEGEWSIRDCGSKNGSYVNRDRFEYTQLSDGDLIHTGNTSFLYRCEVERGHLEPADLSADLLQSSDPASMTLSPSLSRTMSDMARVSASVVSVILGGETGTGKEVCAQTIHRVSNRQGSFVAINCGALPATLMESELFGHRKGAFSGANSDRIGLVQASDGGTLFLDKVAELSPEAQVKLLRVLQEREVQPVGATRPIPVDLRVVCATHANLEALVEAGSFRSDLYARLSGVSFRLPKLAERREDLGILVPALLRRISGGQGISFEREALWAIALYSWPRNIRELEQALAAAVAWAQDGVVALSHLPPALTQASGTQNLSEGEELQMALQKSLRSHRGNVSATAREMGKARVQIRRWCKRFGIDPASYR